MHLLAIWENFDPLAAERDVENGRPMLPHVPVVAKRVKQLAARTAFRTSVIPLLEVCGDLVFGESGEFGRRHRTPQIARIHVARLEPAREHRAQAFARRTRLFAAGPGQRNVGAAGVLARFTPQRLAVAQQHQVAEGLGRSVWSSVPWVLL